MRCPQCEKQIGRHAIQCPHCGILIPRGRGSKLAGRLTMEPRLCMAVGLLLAFIGLVLLMSDAMYFAMLPIVLGGVLIILGKSMKP
ncbi:hypothetical protein [Pseudodesulfovibrio senegalensis]|jgi:hypothetical protein|uniref:Zinc ribbon domain-containing protein n=1 Tax=Pseudodesulfovibrio senegalensis TaxID=1721087 RepID=A0A6N6N413_9BACT|nr:hypothetical protein [Pseudodesulfovibrio senegalensis]KAB1442922.1 hypothetical protein F8A88_01210 [Pseudodesulfovibrio senegalensis]